MIFYVYAGYPLLIGLIALLKNKKVDKKDCEPNVTILIDAYNEADNIDSTITNLTSIIKNPKLKLS